MQALILIDLQEDFFATPAMRPLRAGVVECVHRWVAWARERSFPVIEVRTVNPPDPDTWALNMRDDMQPVVLAGTEGAKRLHDLDFEPDVVVEKRRDDAFHDTELRELLAAESIDSVVLAGVSTEACILMTAASAYANDIRVAIAHGAVAAADEKAHHLALDWLRQQYRQEVITP
ncbi:cysteine hydrolase family protein [Nocardioides jishulii]|uniref:Cysteine hydrolase n=1 Tax=Nocardioides jishulii TaxID=2575440 RepID=A0A4V5TK93_9ACTN|nr:isochorismatase family cysteine hydrolase [Nocardioides jishulii]QCX27846.1 cysteine hydrolase [Nocardioides jishulii]TKI62653.1 cysteine hydrolase [Nocardioides jishulii]